MMIALCMMDTGESPRTFFNMIINRFPKAPKVIVYDNVCHLHQYCMHRAWMYFFNTRFIFDRLHQSNHISCCCRRYQCTPHKDQAIVLTNTQAVEQTNNMVKSRTQKSVRWMTLSHSISYLSSFFFSFNRRQMKTK